MVYVNTKTGVEVLSDCEIIGKDWEVKTSKKKNSKKKASLEPSDGEGETDE